MDRKKITFPLFFLVSPVGITYDPITGIPSVPDPFKVMTWGLRPCVAMFSNRQGAEDFAAAECPGSLPANLLNRDELSHFAHRFKDDYKYGLIDPSRKTNGEAPWFVRFADLC